MNPQSTPAAATVPPQEPNIQNVNPNVIHSTGSTTVTSVSSHITSASPTTSPATGANNKPQVITQNVHAKLSGGIKEERQPQQPESLVVSVPLSSATTVPGIQLPTTNSSNSTSNNNSTVSTIVANQALQLQQPLTTTITIQPSSVPPPQGSLYQHLTNNQQANQRGSPLIQQGVGRASPHTPTPSSLTSDGHGVNNHTSVLQNMNSSTGGVISSAGFHGITNNVSEPSMAGLKVTFEKQAPSRIQAIQQEETTRRSRYVRLFVQVIPHCVVLSLLCVVMISYANTFALNWQEENFNFHFPKASFIPSL